ncbi:hypothetical protein DFAR_3100009 [Desulfarculales bacterium]
MRNRPDHGVPLPASSRARWPVLAPPHQWFCERYREWSNTLGLIIRQWHRAGQKTFIDYAGQPVDVVVSLTGKVRAA